MIYRSILVELERLLPEFVVANAVVHLDEDSPHMHIVGVPVATGYKKGLSKQVSKRKVFTREVLSEIVQDKLREFAGNEVELLFGEQIREKSKGRNHDLSVAEYKVAKETEHYEELKEMSKAEQHKCNVLERLADSKQNQCDALERLAESKQERCDNLERQAEVQQNKYDRLQKQHEALSSDYDRLLGKKAICEVTFEEAEQNVQKSLALLQSYERMIEEKYNLLDKLEEEEQKLRQRVDKAEQIYEVFVGTGGDAALRERMIDVMYENDQLKAENSKLKATLEKAYDFMKQFVINGKNMLEKFLESIGQVVDRARDGVRR